MNKYVILHSYKNAENDNLQKLSLRNMQDLKDYLWDISRVTFEALYYKNKLIFNNREIVRIVIKPLK